MERIDPAKAAAVWQRVHNSQPPAQNEQSLIGLIQDELTDSMVYWNLTKQFSGPQHALLRQLHQQKQSHVACLKGIYTLITGSRPVIRASQPAAEPAEVTLRRCYGREMRRLAQYESRMADTEYGKIFSKLAQQEQEHCRLVLELLGSLQDKK